MDIELHVGMEIELHVGMDTELHVGIEMVFLLNMYKLVPFIGDWYWLVDDAKLIFDDLNKCVAEIEDNH